MQSTIEQGNDEIDLLKVARAILKRWYLVLICAIIGATALGVYSKVLVTPKYAAAASIYVVSGKMDVNIGMSISVSERLAPDFTEIAKSRPVLKKVASKVGHGITTKEVAESLNVENVPETHILRITAVHEDKKLVDDLANAMSDVLSQQVNLIMDMDKPALVESAIEPKKPISPNTKKNVALGGLAGAVLMTGLLAVLDIFDDTVKTEEDVRRYLGLNTLAEFPVQRKRRRGNK